MIRTIYKGSVGVLSEEAQRILEAIDPDLCCAVLVGTESELEAALPDLTIDCAMLDAGRPVRPLDRLDVLRQLAAVPTLPDCEASPAMLATLRVLQKQRLVSRDAAGWWLNGSGWAELEAGERVEGTR